MCFIRLQPRNNFNASKFCLIDLWKCQGTQPQTKRSFCLLVQLAMIHIIDSWIHGWWRSLRIGICHGAVSRLTERSDFQSLRQICVFRRSSRTTFWRGYCTHYDIIKSLETLMLMCICHSFYSLIALKSEQMPNGNSKVLRVVVAECDMSRFV